MLATNEIMKSIVYYPHLRKRCGSVTGAIFMSMLLSEEVTSDMVHLSSSRIELLTGLTYKEQTTAREQLIKSGLIRERYDRINHKLMFSIVSDGALYE